MFLIGVQDDMHICKLSNFLGLLNRSISIRGLFIILVTVHRKIKTCFILFQLLSNGHNFNASAQAPLSESSMYSIVFQEPRPLSQLDLEKVLATTRKTRAAASEYTRVSSQSTGWSGNNREPDDYQVRAAISELSKLMVSQVLNIQADDQDP